MRGEERGGASLPRHRREAVHVTDGPLASARITRSRRSREWPDAIRLARVNPRDVHVALGVRPLGKERAVDVRRGRAALHLRPGVFALEDQKHGLDRVRARIDVTAGIGLRARVAPPRIASASVDARRVVSRVLAPREGVVIGARGIVERRGRSRRRPTRRRAPRSRSSRFGGGHFAFQKL